MAEIITDVDRLHQISEEVSTDEITSIISELRSSIPKNGLGLAAIQIDIPKRIFLANLSSGSYAFVNPQISWKSINTVPFTEGCLSIPDVTRCVERHSEVKITADSIMGFDGAGSPDEMHLRGTDSFVIQHEYDHLNGVLITDLPSPNEKIETQPSKVEERSNQRKQRIALARLKKEQKKNQPVAKKPQKLNVNKQAKLKKATQKKKKQERRAKQREKIRVETEERYKAEQANLFSKTNAQ